MCAPHRWLPSQCTCSQGSHAYQALPLEQQTPEREKDREREVSIIFVCVCVLSDVDLSQSFSVGAHISENNKNVFLALIGHELCRGEGKAGGDDTLNPGEEIINVDESFIYIYTYVGSLAMFKNRQTFSIEPFSSKSCLKKRAVSIFTYQREER